MALAAIQARTGRLTWRQVTQLPFSPVVLARRSVSAGQRRQADSENEDAALEDRLEVGRRAENAEAIESHGEDQHADQSAGDMKLTFAQGGRSEKHRGERVKEIAVGRSE